MRRVKLLLIAISCFYGCYQIDKETTGKSEDKEQVNFIQEPECQEKQIKGKSNDSLRLIYNLQEKCVYGISLGDTIKVGVHYGTLDISPSLEVINVLNKQYVIVKEFITSLGYTYDVIHVYLFIPEDDYFKLVCKLDEIALHEIIMDTLNYESLYKIEILDNEVRIIRTMWLEGEKNQDSIVTCTAKPETFHKNDYDITK